MQPHHRMGLGMMPRQGQGPPIGSLGQQQNSMYPPRPAAGSPIGASGPAAAAVGDKLTTVFIGGISTGVTNEFLNSLFATCGSVRSLTRNVAANGKLQGFGFIEYEDPDAVSRALKLLHGKVIPAQEPDQPNKPLVVRADDKVKAFLATYEAQRIKTDEDEAKDMTAEMLIASIIDQSNKSAEAAGNDGSLSIQASVPQHLRDLSEADLPENHRGVVMSEIALFRERALGAGANSATRSAGVGGFTGAGAPVVPSPSSSTPTAPKERVWGKNNASRSKDQQPASPNAESKGFGSGPQGYKQPVDFVRGSKDAVASREIDKTDEEAEAERKARRHTEELRSFQDRERRWDNREDARIPNLERTIARSRMNAAQQERDGVEMRDRLAIWDDDESDELFYTDRARWKAQRTRFLITERAADEKSRTMEERQAEHLRLESESFLAKQMAEMAALAEDQRKAGFLVDTAHSGGGLKLNIGVSAASKQAEDKDKSKATAADDQPKKKIVFGGDEDDDENGPAGRKKKVPLVKIDFGGFEADGRAERLDKIRKSLKSDKESLFKHKIRWDGITDNMVDKKLEPLVRKLMIKYLGELDDDDMVMYVTEHLKDHKPPTKVIEELEPVLLEEAVEFAAMLWRQVVFESIAYGEGLETDKELADP